MVLHENAQIFNDIPHDQPMIHTMKVLQDKCLYYHQKDWPRFANYFKVTLPEERTFGASEEMIQRWHDILANYLCTPPSIDDLDMLSISLTPEMIDKIGEYYLAYQDNQRLNQVLSDFYDQAIIFYQEEKETASLVD